MNNTVAKLFAIILFVFAVGSCKEKAVDPYLKISSPSATVSAEGGSVYVTVTSNTSWSASSDVSWITVAPASGYENGTVTVAVAANTDEARTGVVTFSWSGTPAVLTVQQGSGKKEDPVPSEGTISIAGLRKLYDEGQKDDKYKTTEKYTLTGSVISDYRKEGLDNYTSLKTIVISDGQAGIMLYCDDSNTAFKLGDEVKVTLPKGQEICRYNEGPLEINGAKLANISKVGEKFIEPVEITAAELLTNRYESMYVAVKDVQCQASEIGKTFVMNSSHTSIHMESKDGEEFEIFTGKDASFGSQIVPTGSGTLKGIGGIFGKRIQISIAQTSDFAGLTGERFHEAPAMALNYYYYTHNGDKGSYTIKVLGNVDWTASCDNEAFSLSKTSGSGAADVVLTFGDNPSTTDSRVAKVTFKTEADVAQKELTFTFTQDAFQPLVSDAVPARLEIPAVKAQDSVVFITHSFNHGSKQQYSYSLYFDARYKVAHWVAYPLYKAMMSGTSRTDEWARDPKVPERDQAQLSRGFADYSRGHQLPSADRLINEEANAQTFYFTNMTPQNQSLNSGVWERLETNLRTVAGKCDTLYIVTGCVVATKEDSKINYTEDNIGANVAVPKAYYKVCLKYDANSGTNGGYKAIGFWMENKAVGGKFSDYVKSVDEIELLTGFDFFPNLDDAIEEAVEMSTNTDGWNM